MTIIGVHSVDAFEPCHLIEVELDVPIDWGKVTQEVDGQPADNWQVPWDEQRLDDKRWVFFFHYLQFDRPLLTPEGPIPVPPKTPLPERLSGIEYETP
jgi:hypothetical protein